MHTVLCAALVLAAASAAEESIPYTFLAVRGRVTVTSEAGSRRAAAGEVAFGGDRVATSWLGRAELETKGQASRFVIYPRTRVVLGARRPEVLLLLQRGKLEALFDALVGGGERWVETPGALLAVRGTHYGVEVDSRGTTNLVVFEGRVQVVGRQASWQPVIVDAGQVCRFGRTGVPRVEPAPGGADAGRWRRGGAAAPSSSAPPGRPPMGPGDAPGATPRRGHGEGERE